LVQADIDFREGFTQLGHRLRQHIPGLRVGRGNRQRSTVLLGVLLANTPQITDFTQDQINAFEDMLAGLRHAFEPFAMAGKNLNAKLFFQLNDGFGNTRLRGMQNARGFGQIEVAANGFLDKSELVKIHIKFRLEVIFNLILPPKNASLGA